MTRICVIPSNTVIIPNRYQDSDGRYSLDVFDTNKIAQTFQDDWDISGEINKTAINRSYPLTIPATPKNNLLLEHLADENIINSQFFNNGYIVATVVSDGDVTLDGVMILTSYERMDGQVQSYEIIVLGKEKFWISTLQNTPLASLPYQNIAFNSANVLSNIQSVTHYDGNQPYTYGPIFHGKLKNQTYGDFTTYNDWLAEDMSILVFVKYIFELMEQQLKGWSFVSEFINSNMFSKLTLHALENFRQSEEDVKANQSEVTFNNDSQIYTSPYNGNIQFPLEVFDNNNLHNQNNYSVQIKVEGLYKLSFILKYIVYGDTIISTDSIVDDTNFDLQIVKNNQVIYTENHAAINIYTPIEINQEISFNEGDIIYIRIVTHYSGNASDFKFVIKSGTTTNLALQKEIIDMVVNPSDYINPSYSCWDLFEDILTLHNCRLRTDYELKQIIFEPAADYYKPNTQAIDWTDKVGGMKRVTEMTNSIRFFYFKYVNDSGDKYYNATRTGGRIALYDKQYDFLEDYQGERFQGTTPIELNMLAATRMMKVAEDTDVPCVTENQIFGGEFDRNSLFYQIEEEAERTYKFSPRLFYWLGMGSFGTGTDWNFEGVNYQQIPIVQIANRYNSDEYDLSWEYLFEQYWKAYIQNINFNGLISTYAILNKLDILNFDTRYKVRIDQNYYYLKVIALWLADKVYEPVSIKLLKAH